jgi:hypothetical protein
MTRYKVSRKSRYLNSISRLALVGHCQFQRHVGGGVVGMWVYWVGVVGVGGRARDLAPLC